MHLDSYSISQHHTTHLPSSFFDGCILWSLHISIGFRATPENLSFISPPATVLLSPTCAHLSFPISHQWKLTSLTVPPTFISPFSHETPLPDTSSCFVLHYLSSVATCALLRLLYICLPPLSSTTTPSSFLHIYNSFTHLSLCHLRSLHSSVIHSSTWHCNYCSVTGHLSSIPLHCDHVMWSSIEQQLISVSLLEHLVPPPTCHVHPHSLSAPLSLHIT